MEKFKYCILYVDDEEINLRVFKSTFEDEFEVFTALSGEEGLKIFQENKIDLIITDQRMPEMTGVEFLKRVLEYNPEPNRILLTAFSDIDALSSAVNEGKIYQYINKPWDESELKPVIYQALESYYLKRENQALTIALQEKNNALNQEVEEKRLALEQLSESERALRLAKEKAEESDKLKTSFLNNMSHEIRTPLNGIVGFSELICEDDSTLEERRAFAKYISQNSADLLDIIQNIVLLSKIETENQINKPSRVDCHELCEGLAADYEKRFAEKGLNLHWDCLLNEDERFVYLDKDKTHEIIKQLLDNALKFTEKGEVILQARKLDKKLHLTVRDTGIGIPLKQQHLVFDRFRKIESHDQKLYRGNGVGLCIAKAYTKLLDGTIHLESDEIKGSTFTLILPFAEAAVLGDVQIVRHTNLRKTFNILVVEDEEDNVVLLRLFFKNAGVNIQLANNGIEAVEMCRTHPEIDLVLMDLRIPQKDGFQATIEIKKIRPDVIVIAQSAYAFESDKARAKEAGCDDFIVKPITKAKVQRLIEMFNR